MAGLRIQSFGQNETGKSSLLNLIFSTYRPTSGNSWASKQKGKARELADYVRERDLAFVITEWDISDDQVQATLLCREFPWTVAGGTDAFMAGSR